MASCLGISTESNLIKYAKVTKEQDSINIDAFGVKFFDKLEDAVNQIIEETQSTNIPININLSDEMYNKFEVFNGLKKKDVSSLLSSEFELLCEEKSLNFQALTSQYILSSTPLNKDKSTALYVSANKGDIVGKLQKLEKYKINNLIPVPIALYNLKNFSKENTVIINIEDKTTLTFISNGEIIDVQVIDLGMKQVLDKISKKENSYVRAYEACKNTTIYTMDLVEGQMVGNEYLADIMPILYEIITQVKDILDNNFLTMQKVYITGTATIINNIDLYFQEYFINSKCEILIPDNIDNKKRNINVKEYVEVNSAIALAKQGLGEGVQDTNFKNVYTSGSFFEEVKRIATTDIDFSKIKLGKSNKGGSSTTFNFSLKGSLDRIESDLFRITIGLVLLIIIFLIVSIFITSMINEKIADTDEVINSTKKIITVVESDKNKTQAKTTQYAERIQKLEDLNNQIRTEYKYRRAIPNLLNQIMAVIPKDVQLTSIENNSENKILIKAQAEKYEELGYFGAVLKNQGILLDVTTSPGVREDSLVKIDIEGNLP